MRTIVRNSYTPQIGDYCNKIVVDQDNGVQYIFDSDGVYSVYTSKQQEGAPMFYVDSTVNAAKNELKTYTDTKDAQILAEAKAYADQHSGDAITFIDLTVTGMQATDDGYELSATPSKSLSEMVSAWENGSDLRYRLVLETSPSPQTIAPGTYEIAPLYIGSSFGIASFMDSYNGLNLSVWHEAGSPDTVTVTVYSSQSQITVDSALSNSSTNPVQNKIIASALDNKVDLGSLATVALTGAYSDLTGTPSTPVFTLTSSDPGEGGTLAANNFVAVYLEESE